MSDIEVLAQQLKALGDKIEDLTRKLDAIGQERGGEWTTIAPGVSARTRHLPGVVETTFEAEEV